jgi:hypothetical protein
MTDKIKERIEKVLPKGWVYCVQESVGLPINVFAVKTDKGKLLYVKLPSSSDTLFGELVFEVLSKEECQKLGISVEETYSSGDYHVEESTENDEDDKIWHPDRESLEDYKRRVLQIKKGSGIVLPEDIEKIKEERDDFKQKLTLIASRRFEKKKEGKENESFIGA